MKVLDKFTIHPRRHVAVPFTPATHSFKTQISECNCFQVSERDLTVTARPNAIYARTIEQVQNLHPKLFLRQPGWRLALRNLEQACKIHRELVRSCKNPPRNLTSTEAAATLGISVIRLKALSDQFPAIGVKPAVHNVSPPIYSPEAMSAVRLVLKMLDQGKKPAAINKVLMED